MYKHKFYGLSTVITLLLTALLFALLMSDSGQSVMLVNGAYPALHVAISVGLFPVLLLMLWQATQLSAVPSAGMGTVFCLLCDLLSSMMYAADGNDIIQAIIVYDVVLLIFTCLIAEVINYFHYKLERT